MMSSSPRSSEHPSRTERTLDNSGSSLRIPVQVSASLSSNDTLEHTEDPFEDMGHQMDHEVERVLREWDTNTQRITHNTFRLRPNPAMAGVSSSTPNSPFNPRKKKFSNSVSNLSTASAGEVGSRKSFDFPEINVRRREDSRLDTSVESLTEEIKSPLYTTCPKTGAKLLRMEFDTEGYGPENFTVRVAEQKLIIHAVQNEIIDGRKSTTEFCRKVKLPVDVNSKSLQCFFNTDNNMLIAEVPVKSPQTITSPSPFGGSPGILPHSMTSSSTFGGNPGILSSTSDTGTVSSLASTRQQLLNIPFVKQDTYGKVMVLNVEVGRVFKPDDITVKVKGQDKVIVSAERVENTDSSKLNASIYREFDLSDKIIGKTLKAGVAGDGILRVSALLDDPVGHGGLNGHISVKIEQNGMDVNQENNTDLNEKL